MLGITKTEKATIHKRSKQMEAVGDRFTDHTGEGGKPQVRAGLGVLQVGRGQRI